MAVRAESSGADTPEISGGGWAILAAAGVCLIGAGGLLWWRQGDAVFSDLVLSALAWCF